MLLSVLELYIFLIDDWNVSRLRTFCNSNYVFIFSYRSSVKTGVLANTCTKYFFLFWVGVYSKCELFTALLVLHFQFGRKIAEADLAWGLLRALQALRYLPRPGIWDYPSSSAPCLSCSRMFETSLFPSLSSMPSGTVSNQAQVASPDASGHRASPKDCKLQTNENIEANKCMS